MTLRDLIYAEARKSSFENETHHKVCKELVKLSEENNFPMGVLVYIAVGTSAHKPSVFEKGYTKINMDKAVNVIKLCNIFAHKYGAKYATNDKVVHTMSRYYEVGGSKNKLRKIVNASTIDFKEMKIDTAKKLMGILFKDHADFSDKGYILGLK